MASYRRLEGPMLEKNLSQEIDENNSSDEISILESPTDSEHVESMHTQNILKELSHEQENDDKNVNNTSDQNHSRGISHERESKAENDNVDLSKNISREFLIYDVSHARSVRRDTCDHDKKISSYEQPTRHKKNSSFEQTTHHIGKKSTREGSEESKQEEIFTVQSINSVSKPLVGSPKASDSPYDEHDELSISHTPQENRQSHSSSSASSGDGDSLCTSPFSQGSVSQETCESEDVFAMMMKNVPESPSACTSSSDSPSSFYSDASRDILKSALKRRNSSIRHSNRVSWLVDSADEQSGAPYSPTFEQSTNDIGPDRMSKDTFSIYDESVASSSPPQPLSRNVRAAVNPRDIYKNENRNNDCFENNSPMCDSAVSITPPPLSKSIRAAVNPREQKVVRDENHEKENDGNRSSSNRIVYNSPTGETMCSYSPLQMTQSNKGTTKIHRATPQSPSALCLSPLQRTPMQARKWRTLAAEAEAKKKSSVKKKKNIMSLKRTPLGKLKVRKNVNADAYY